jgi:hypothetical protein
MALIAGDITGRAASIIFDETHIRWPEAELIKHINDGQREIVNLRPDACAVTESISLVVGVKQSIPATAIRLLDIVRNMGADGSTPGAAIIPADMDKVRRYNPGWATTTASSTVKNYMYDPRIPGVFYVFPPVTGTVQVEGQFVRLPTDCASTASSLSINDSYANALVNWTVYRTLLKDLETPNAGQAKAYYELFLNSMQGKTAADIAALPDSSFAPIGGTQRGAE